jgi:mono/diheme cytochrome c family protein
MIRRLTACTIVALACGDAEPPPLQTPVLDSAARAALADSAEIARGQAVYRVSCSECHTIQPPPLTAPPLADISRRYRELFADREDALRYLIDYTSAPDLANARLDQRHLDEWGLMPSVNLPENDLHAVARWVWELAARDSTL